MKVTPPPIPPPRERPVQKETLDANKPTTSTKRAANSGNATSAADANVDATGVGRDFASVLKDVSRPSERDEGEEGEGADQKRESRPAKGAERERETGRREDSGEGSGERGGGGHMSQRGAAGSVRETGTTLGETTSARAILHIADLERILAAVRTQTTLTGRREVTLELQRSVLEGLRVKLSTDERGRVTAEFIASTERVRAQIDARSNDLSDLLRSRGVDLASLKTSLGADASNQHGAGEGHQSPSAERAALSQDGVRRGAANASEAHDDANNRAQDVSDSDSTYRA